MNVLLNRGVAMHYAKENNSINLTQRTLLISVPRQSIFTIMQIA